MGIDTLEAVLLTVVTAATPLLLASIGELVTERAGVLNLGVEGMMIVGAVCGFAAGLATGSPLIGCIAAVLGGMALSALFALLTLGLAANQVASGLATTLLGLGLSGLIGQAYVGRPGVRLTPIEIPVLSDLPLVGRLVFGQDPLVYVSLLLTAAVSWFLFRTRAGLVLRAVGDSHGSAHSIGYNVLGVRALAVLFGGGCAGLAGAYLSLVYTPQWVEGMSAGRGWIAVALVVFATWRPARALGGAYLFGAVLIMQLHLQAIELSALTTVMPESLARAVKGAPSQLMSALPYLATIIALVIISRNRRLLLANTPQSLGQSFVPER